MKGQTKIQLSVLERELVSDAGWILTKNAIIEKVKQFFEQMHTRQQEILPGYSAALPREILVVPPKISRGENYKGLPWIILDYPRIFSQDNIFAIRTLFWWGKFFSCTLHLAGDYKMMLEKKIIASFPMLKENDFFICVNAGQWEHHFEEENFLPVGHFTENEFEELTASKGFIKLSKKTAVGEWEEASEKLTEVFRQYIMILSDQFPRR